MIHKDEWEWYGQAGHFILGPQCRFHMATKVGKFWVSTVGELWPDAPIREIYAKVRGVTLEGRGDAREVDYMQKIGFEKIGTSGTYETMVFLAGPPCDRPDCGCDLPLPTSFADLGGERYETASEARAGHLRYCAHAANDEIKVREDSE